MKDTTAGDGSPLLRMRRTLMAAGALFAAIFTLLALQLWLGHDPALGDGAAHAPQKQEQKQRETHASVWDSVLGAAAAMLEDDDDHDGSSSQSQPLQSRSS